MMSVHKKFTTVLLPFAALFWVASASADVYLYKDKQGVLNFTNVPNHAGYRRVLKESSGQATSGSIANGYASNASRLPALLTAYRKYGSRPEVVDVFESQFCNSGAVVESTKNGRPMATVKRSNTQSTGLV